MANLAVGHSNFWGGPGGGPGGGGVALQTFPYGLRLMTFLLLALDSGKLAALLWSVTINLQRPLGG